MEHIPYEFRDNRCLYCRKELAEWNSSWDAGQHYKNIPCDCGKENWIKVEFEGSGHDFLFKTVPRVESVRRKVQER
ncbi:hypothetical protein HYX14_05145 [Candidatus Woesearchaeota archaeon]|nr:hypothetical protein [Candidatus Woesearchaeota archaeon]